MSADSVATPLVIVKTKSDSLIVAARENDLVLAKKLIEKGADVNHRVLSSPELWISSLSEAARRNNTAMVRMLAEAGADPNLHLGRNSTAFLYAAGGCSLDVGRCSDTIFNLLLAKGGNVNTFNEYFRHTPLINAIGSGDIRKVEILLRHGVVIDPDSINDFQSPLSRAASQLRFDILKMLLDNNANVNATYSLDYGDCIRCPEKITIVHDLVLMHSYEQRPKVDSMLDLVLQYKPDLNIESGYGHTALAFAAYGNSTDLVDKLIAHGAKPETRGGSSLHGAASYSNYTMLEHLLKQGADPNVKSESGYTPLHHALACCGDGFGEGITEQARIKTIALLLDHGADPNIKNFDGRSFLDESKESPHKEVIKYLVKRGLLPSGK